MPLPHICIEITWRVASGSTTQDVFVWLPSTPAINEPSRLECGQNLRAPDSGWGLQILPRLQGENWASVSEVVGFMMNLEPALHVVVLKGQQALDIVQPSVHFGNHISRVNVGRKIKQAHIVLGLDLAMVNGSPQREERYITYNRAEIVTDLMRNDLPLGPASG
jgi:hypothetical protein